MNLSGRVSLLLGISLLFFGLLFGEMLSRHFQRIELAKEKEYLARYIREEVGHRDLSPEDFTVPKTGQAYESFRSRLEEIRDFGNVFMVVVFSPDGTVVWSDSREMVGRRFSSRALRKALGGEVVSEWTTPERENHSFPVAPKEILELHVPIPGKTAGSVIGVIETYQDADGLRASIRREVMVLWIALGGGFFFLYLVLFGIVRKGHRRILSSREELTERLIALMNNVPGLVYRGYPDWSVGFMGAGAERITGYAADDFLHGALSWKDLVVPEDLERIRQPMRKSLRRKDRLLRVEYRIRQKDGSVKWIADRRQLVYDSGERLLHIDGLVLDITERKRSEEMLRLIQFTVDRAGDAAYWMDAEGRFLYVNETICATLGYSRAELLTMSIREINPDFPEDSWRGHWEEIRRRRSFLMETRHRAKDGRFIPVEVTVNYLEFDGKEYNCAFARDITERLRSREESERLQAQLLQSQKMEALGILAGGVAHDFNNLLTGILGYADLLDREAAPGSRTGEAARVIRDSAERASRLTAQLLGFARKGKNLAVPVDLRKTVGDLVKILERTLDRRIRITTRFPDEEPTVLGDPTQLSQVAMNLGVNARDAMPEGGELAISIERRDLGPEFCRENPGVTPGRYVVLSFRDTGVGIPEKHLPRVFDPFFSTKELGKGSGLGLSMVFGIVKNHGGCITVHSGEGEGTMMTVYLPAHEGGAAAEDPGGAPAVSRPGKRGVVLLVDDEETVREVCTSMLDVLGYEVISAKNGEEGVARYRDRWKEIDLVILDMIMPKMGGRDCFRRIREINPHARALLATGYSLDGAVQEILNEGMEGFLQKPFRLDQLAGAVSHAMQRAS